MKFITKSKHRSQNSNPVQIQTSSEAAWAVGAVSSEKRYLFDDRFVSRSNSGQGDYSYLKNSFYFLKKIIAIIISSCVVTLVPKQVTKKKNHDCPARASHVSISTLYVLHSKCFSHTHTYIVSQFHPSEKKKKFGISDSFIFILTILFHPYNISHHQPTSTAVAGENL